MTKVKTLPNDVTPEEVIRDSLPYLDSLTERSIGSDGGCAYRGMGGSMCVVGRYIPDEKYHPSIEGKTVYDILATNLPLWARTDEMPLVLDMLQDIHDNGFVEERRYEAKKLMAKYEIDDITLDGELFTRDNC